MSDCEGVIGTSVCQKLYQDFVTYEEKLVGVKMEEAEGDFFMDKYREFKEAFKLASDQGVLIFC